VLIRAAILSENSPSLKIYWPVSSFFAYKCKIPPRAIITKMRFILALLFLSLTAYAQASVTNAEKVSDINGCKVCKISYFKNTWDECESIFSTTFSIMNNLIL